MRSVEQTLERFYRGERLEDALDRSNRGIQAYNAHATALQSQNEHERLRAEKLLDEAREGRLRLEELDRELKNPPPRIDPEAQAQKVNARNALVRKTNEQSAAARLAADEYNALVRRTLDEMERERKRVLAVQDAVNARLAAYDAFTKAGQDADFFIALNRLLADVRGALREGPGDPTTLKALARIRGYRRELALWAQAGQARKPNGLVIVEALVEDEPCWFVLDTGAMDTILSEEIVDAIGHSRDLGKETTLSVVGGLRVTGLAFRIPRLRVGDQVMSDVQAAAVRPSDVGIDGLLGQSFLKSFIYTIDERQPGKVIFIRP